MTTYHQHWFATVDRGRARLFSCHLTPGGRRQVKEQSTLVNDELNHHEHRRPAMLGRDPGGRAHLAATTHEAEEERRRFAREAAAWLMNAAAEHNIPTVHLFAPGRMLHELERQWPAGWRARFEGREGNLTSIPTHELATHPAVVSAIGDEVRQPTR